MLTRRLTMLILLLLLTSLTACGSAVPVTPANPVAKAPANPVPTNPPPIVAAAAPTSQPQMTAPANLEQMESYTGTIALISLEGSADLTSAYKPAAIYLVGGKPRKITKILAGGTYSQVSLTPDSRLLAFRDDGLTLAADKSIKENPDKAGVYLMPLPDGQPKLIRAGAANPQFSPDGSTLAYSAPADPAKPGLTDIYLYQTASGKETRLTQAQPDAAGIGGGYGAPRWSPTGKSLAIHLLTGNGGSQVALLPLGEPNQAASSIKPIPAQPEGARWASAASWSPDRKHLVFAAGGCCPAEPQTLLVADSATGATAKLAVAAQTPLWSPKGDAILVEQDEGVYVVTPDGQDSRLLFGHPEGYVTRPLSWNPSGSHLLYIIIHKAGDSGRFNGLYVGQASGKSILLYAGFILDVDWEN